MATEMTIAIKQPAPPDRQPSLPGKQAPGMNAYFIHSEMVNIQRMGAAFHAFSRDEFGTGPSSPSWPHLEAANRLIEQERQRLLQRVQGLDRLAAADGGPPQFQELLRTKTLALVDAKRVERIWDFYFEIFNQRQSRFADLLRAADRVALDCYQVVYSGLGAPRSIPSPPPFSYMETGATPATFRRNVRLTRLGKRMNPFPIIDLPYHRLINPWTLGAIHHEVSHNIQSDLNLWDDMPRHIHKRLAAAGLGEPVARTWARWHKETWADLCGLLLGGPAVVASLIGVVARAPEVTLAYSSGAVHPTPYLRPLISVELLRRMGFKRQAEQFASLLKSLYPMPERGSIPRPLLDTFPQASRVVVDTMCYQPYEQFGGKRLAEVVMFTPNHQAMVQEAAQRVASDTDPGIIPARFLVGAARYALDHQLASPRRIANNFYKALMKR